MSDYMIRAEELEKKAERKINSLGLFGSKYEVAADLFASSANQFKLAKSFMRASYFFFFFLSKSLIINIVTLHSEGFLFLYLISGDRAGSAFIKLSNCHLKLDSKHEAAASFADAAKCYKKTSSKGAISCFERAVDIFLDMGRYYMAATHCKEIGDLYEKEQNHEKAIPYFERAADYFECAESISLANQCKLKVAQFSALLEQYQKAIGIYEEIARYSLNINLLKYGVREHLLNAGLCQLCRGDVVAITNALERYEDMDPTFSRSREYKFLSDLAAAIDEEDVSKFIGIVKEFDSITKLDSWKVTILLRVKNALKAKEVEDDLT